ncbi:MAG: HupE/UreJ family protein, partial [Gammaproteobacteria bacterium]|nr:HupE/UreJ family protein [Gammaproteobacteria bacterium]
MQYIIILLLFFSTSVLAHKSSDSYLALNIENREIFVRWDIALQDLNNVISLDRNNDGKLQWGELRQDKNKVFAYSFARLDLFSNSSSCEITPLDIKVNQRSDGYYAVLFANALCVDNIDTLNVDYQLFFEVDAQHRGLAKISTKGGDISYAFSPDQSDKLFEIG